MASKHYFLNIILRIAVIVLTSLGIAYSFVLPNLYLIILFIILIIIESIWLIKYINQTNKKILFFFESIKNNDFNLNFSNDAPGSILRELSNNINHINKHIEQIHAEKHTQEIYYKSLLNQINIGILAIDDDGTVLFKNSKLEELFHYTSLYNVQHLQKVNKQLFEFIHSSNRSNELLLKFSNERETVQLIVKLTLFKSLKKTIKLVTFQNIKEELDRNKTDSWMKLIRVMTHEIMNSVAPITSISDSILGFFKNDDDSISNKLTASQLKNTVKGLQVIQLQGQHLSRFINSYRSIINVPLPDKSVFFIKDLFSEVIDLLSADVAKKNVTIDISDTNNEFDLFADKQQINQVLINLINNSIQSFSSNHSKKIHLKSGINSSRQKFISVSDNGSGIPKELIEDIFVPFFTTKEDGNGIGLSLSKQIMHLHGGNIVLHSNTNEGTTVTLLF